MTGEIFLADTSPGKSSPGEPTQGKPSKRKPSKRETNIIGLSDEQLTGMRGSAAAMVFQDPLSALHPYYG